jgi:hypothetical protein
MDESKHIFPFYNIVYVCARIYMGPHAFTEQPGSGVDTSDLCSDGCRSLWWNGDDVKTPWDYNIAELYVHLESMNAARLFVTN